MKTNVKAKDEGKMKFRFFYSSIPGVSNADYDRCLNQYEIILPA